MTTTYHVFPDEVTKSCRWKTCRHCLCSIYFDEDLYFAAPISGLHDNKGTGFDYLYDMKLRTAAHASPPHSRGSAVSDEIRQSLSRPGSSPHDLDSALRQLDLDENFEAAREAPHMEDCPSVPPEAAEGIDQPKQPS